MRDLRSEIAVFLASRPEGCGFREVARGIHARAADVRQMLLDDPGFAGPFRSAESPRRFVYRLAIFCEDAA